MNLITFVKYCSKKIILYESVSKQTQIMNSLQTQHPLFFKLLLFITIILFLFNCGTHQLNKSNLPADSFNIFSLETFNISENLTPISTQNDEVFFMMNLIQENEHKFKIKDGLILKELLFDSLKTSYSFNNQLFELENIDYIVFSLVELDDYDSHSKIERILKEKIEEGIFLERINKTDMDSILSNDDFLGMKYLRRDRIFKEKEIELKITGMQLFDKYDYRIKLKGN